MQNFKIPIPKVSPTLDSLLKQVKHEVEYNINCHRIGSIISFNPTNQTAEVQMVDFIYKPSSENNTDGVVRTVPNKLINVPVKLNATLMGGLTIPINAGDFCLLEFNDRDITNWLEASQEQEIELGSYRSHSFSDGIALIGLFPSKKTIPNYNNNATELFYQNTRISLDEKVGILNPSGSLLQAIQALIQGINALGNAVSSAQTIPAQIDVPLTLDGGTQSSISDALNEISNALIKFENLLK